MLYKYKDKREIKGRYGQKKKEFKNNKRYKEYKE